MENDLISRSALKQYVNDRSTHWLNEWDTAGVFLAIERASAVDAVEVVRCKDCIHYEPCEGGKDYCCWHRSAIVENDFCSYGERRADDGRDK